jgi:hypothetical protein
LCAETDDQSLQIVWEAEAMKHIDKARFLLYNKEKETYTCGTG